MVWKKKYNELFNSVVNKKFLDWPKRNPASNNVYKILRPKSPYALSTLMEQNIGIGTFVRYATYNLYKRDNIPPICTKNDKTETYSEKKKTKINNMF